MSHARDKAEGFTKQLIGEMIGDDLLVREGKAQQHHADHVGEPASPPTGEAPSPQKPVETRPAERGDH